jgi:aminoacrylate hydrolase
MPHADGLYYELHGPADAPPVLFSSGLGGSGSYWRPNLDALAQRHRVILYDHRGTGRSDAEVTGELTLESLGEDMRRLIDALDLPAPTIVGHAIGGMAAMALALAAPERVARLVVVNGWARLDRHTERCFDTRLALLRDSGAAAYLHAQPLFLFPPQWISDHHDALVAEAGEQAAHFPGVAMVERRIAAARRFDIADSLADIRVPTLLIASDDDMLVPAARSAAIEAGVPGARLMRFESGGHACNVTRADDFNACLLGWLADT